MPDYANVALMVLDDDPLMAKLLDFMLRRLGVAPARCVTGGPQALQMIEHEQYQPELILVDLNMPEMSGMEFLERLAALRFGGSVVLVSGEDAQTLAASRKLVEAQQIQVLGCLVKPVSFASLAELIGSWQRAER